MALVTARLLGAWCIALLLPLVVGCDALTPDAPAADEVLDGPLAGLSSEQLAVFLRGDEEFARRFTAAGGLGPLFIATSCDACHAGDGKGHPVFDITRFGRMAGVDFDPMEPSGGPQLQNRAVHGYVAEVLPSGVTGVARFTAPSVTGLGYLEAVDDATILALTDPGDADGDGISGRPHFVDSTDFIAEIVSLERLVHEGPPTRHVPVDGKYLGRFGKKGRVINLLQQTVFAYSEDMGLTTDLVPADLFNRQVGGFTDDAAADPEVPSGTVSSVVFYLRTLRAPPRRGADSPDVQAGEALFAEAGCAGCHVPALRTGRSDIAALDGVEFHPYTDLLLHDMGPELDDAYTEGDAATAEWRTAPLWGLGLAEGSQGGTPFYLHDGRARTLRDAIRFHGGEAAASRAAFDALPAGQQEQLLAFLRSL